MLLKDRDNWLIRIWEIWTKFQIRNFQARFSNWWLGYLLWKCERWMSLELTDDKSTLTQAMAWCHQAPIPMLTQFFAAIWRHWASMILSGLPLCRWIFHNVLVYFHNIFTLLPCNKGIKRTTMEINSNKADNHRDIQYAIYIYCSSICLPYWLQFVTRNEIRYANA